MNQLKNTGRHFLGLLIVLLLLVAGNAYGQQKTANPLHPIVKKELAAPHLHKFKDTLHFKRSIAETQNIVLKDSMLNEIGIDSLLDKVENVHNTLNEINNTTATGFNTWDIESDLPQIDSNIDIIDDNVSLYNSVLDVKNLQMFDVLLADLQKQLSDWRNTLFKYNKQLLDMNADMAAFRKDTILRALLADSSFKSLYGNEIKDLKSKWGLAKKALNDSRSRINQLQAGVSNQYFETIDLQNNIHDLLRKISIKSIGKEYDYLWNIRSNNIGENEEAKELVRKSYRGQRKILSYYFQRNWDNQFWMLLTGLIIFFWIFRGFVVANKRGGAITKENTTFHFIQKASVLAILVVMFSLAPFFDIHPPTAYVEISEFFMVIALTLLLWKNWPRHLYYYWLVTVAVYVVLSVTGTIFVPSLGFRVFLLVVNICSVLFGMAWYRILNKYEPAFNKMVKIVVVIYTVLNLAAIACNLLGRLSLTKIFSVTAIFSLTQIVGLVIFIQIIIEAFRLQSHINQLKGGLTAKLNFGKIERLLTRGLTIVAVVLWGIVFTINLNIYNLLFERIGDFLTTPRKIGGTTFEIGHLLLFFAIIYVSNLLQQGIGSMYGKTEDSWDPEVKKNGSRLAMTRLVLIVIGFMIAVAASGLPLDKITIVLGALGVGIGLGLQTIVNNLVSGVILIFEQPFRIGDTIELGDKRGRVVDIGIRSSRMVMEEGAELIMPNADLLSGRVINWTLRDDNIRIELPIVVDRGEHTFEEIRDAIIAVLAQNEHVVKTPAPEILYLGLKDKSMGINILAWVDDVHRIQAIKSDLLNLLNTQLAAKDIKMIG